MSRRGSRRAPAPGSPAPRSPGSRRRPDRCRRRPAGTRRAGAPRCSAIAANCTAAGQPSVSSCSRSSSSLVSGTSWRAKKSAISWAPKRRSSLRSSSRSPWSRSRASDKGGSDRVPATNRNPSGRASMKAVSTAGEGAARCRSSTTITPGVSTVASSLATATAGSWVLAPSRSSSTKASSATPGQRAAIADSRQDMKRVGSTSVGSHDSHATCSECPAAHEAIAAVLP